MGEKFLFYIFSLGIAIFLGILIAVLTSSLAFGIFQFFNTLFWIFLVKKIKGS